MFSMAFSALRKGWTKKASLRRTDCYDLGGDESPVGLVLEAWLEVGPGDWPLRPEIGD